MNLKTILYIPVSLSLRGARRAAVHALEDLKGVLFGYEIQQRKSYKESSNQEADNYSVD